VAAITYAALNNTQLQQRPRACVALAPASAVTEPGRLLQALVRCVHSVSGYRLGPMRDASVSLRLPQATINALAQGGGGTTALPEEHFGARIQTNAR
jgi:hypothetical protein